MVLWFEFEILVVIFTLVILGYAAVHDWKYREVIDLPWIILIFFSFPINIVRFILYWETSQTLIVVGIISIVIGLSFIISMAYLGFWGGADILALLSLILIIPFPIITPDFYSTNLNLLFFLFPFSLTILLNSTLLQIPIPFLLLFKNVINLKKHPERYVEPISSTRIEKILSSFLGNPLQIHKISSMNPWYFNFMEDLQTPFKISWNDFSIPKPFIRLTSEQLLRYKSYSSLKDNFGVPMNLTDGNKRKIFSLDVFNKRRVFSHKIKLGTPEQDLMDQRIKLDYFHNKQNRQYVWIQYSIPFITFIFLGFLFSLFGGNLLFLLMSLI